MCCHEGSISGIGRWWHLQNLPFNLLLQQAGCQQSQCTCGFLFIWVISFLFLHLSWSRRWCWRLSHLHKDEGTAHPWKSRQLLAFRPMLASCRLCPGISPCCQNTFRVLSASGLEPGTFPLPSPVPFRLLNTAAMPIIGEQVSYFSKHLFLGV